METQTYELMSDVNGDPIEVAANAKFVRIRKVVGRGASVLVLKPDKTPVRLPIEGSIADAYEAVNQEPGDYRLWPLDAAGRPIKGATPGIFVIPEPPNGAAQGAVQKELASAMAALADALKDANATSRELARTNSDMANKVISNYASTLEAGATVIRAAHGAGITERVEGTEPETEEVEEEAEEMTYVEQAVKGACESIGVFVGMKVDEMAAAKKAREQQQETPPPAHTPPPVPRQASAPSRPRVAVPKSPRPPGVPVTIVEPKNEPPRNDSSGVPSGQQAMHLIAIKSRLAPHEVRFIEKSIANMGAEERAQWIADLCSRSVEDAIALVRSVIENVKNTKGDAS